jgi:hypothetical protein
VTPAATRLGPGAATRVAVVVVVPEDVRPGLRSAVVWAQVDDGAAGGVVQVRRVGLRVHLEVVRPSLLLPAAVAAGLVLLAGAGVLAGRRRTRGR